MLQTVLGASQPPRLIPSDRMACARTAQLQLQRLLPRASSSFSVITTATRIDPWGQAHRIFAGGAACHWNRRETGSLFIATGIHVRVEVAAAGGGGRRSCGYTRRCIQRACFYGRNSGARSWLKLWCSWSFDTLIRSRGTITCTQASNTCKENRKKGRKYCKRHFSGSRFFGENVDDKIAKHDI